MEEGTGKPKKLIGWMRTYKLFYEIMNSYLKQMRTFLSAKPEERDYKWWEQFRWMQVSIYKFWAKTEMKDFVDALRDAVDDEIDRQREKQGDE